MSVAAHLGLDAPGKWMDAAERCWPVWVEQDPRLAAVPSFAGLRGWLRSVDPAGADAVLHAVATLGARSWGDCPLAASVLAWALLPGACSLARQLVTLTPRIDEMVAAQLWIEVRSFPWERLCKVAANILDTRAGVLRECGVRSQVERDLEPLRAGRSARCSAERRCGNRGAAALAGRGVAGAAR